MIAFRRLSSIMRCVALQQECLHSFVCSRENKGKTRRRRRRRRRGGRERVYRLHVALIERLVNGPFRTTSFSFPCPFRLYSSFFALFSTTRKTIIPTRMPTASLDLPCKDTLAKTLPAALLDVTFGP
ncbi:unnamed protein product, partial [Musa hybrid cultivar]